jgi:hypothetical protein
MKSQKKEEKKEIIVLDEGIQTDVSGDPFPIQICCWVVLVAIRGR